VCNKNNLTSLEGAPSSVGDDFWCSDNKLASLSMIHQHVKHIGGVFHIGDNPICECVLGLLLIEGLQKVIYAGKSDVMYHTIEIVNRHLPNRKGKSALIHYQNELLDNGFEEYARL